MPRSGLRSVVDTGLFDYGPERSRLLLRLWRVLARGKPLGRSDIESAAQAASIGLEAAIDFPATGTERHTSGRITGLLAGDRFGIHRCSLAPGIGAAGSAMPGRQQAERPAEDLDAAGAATAQCAMGVEEPVILAPAPR